VRVIMPRYRSIDGAKYGLKRIDRFIAVPAGEEVRTTEIETTQIDGVPVYFVWDERFFGHEPVYGRPDEAMAFVFFCRAAIEFLRTLDWQPDVIHCHDWHSGAALMFLNLNGRADPKLKSIASTFTIHNLVYQGVTGNAIFRFAGFEDHVEHIKGEQPGTANWMARGIAHADVVNTVSPTYAEEILTVDMGAGLDGLLRSRRSRVSGILNGIDRVAWNPATDRALAAPFDLQSIRQRAANKRAVQEQLGLKRKPHTPLIGVISRLVEQKGVDILLEAAEKLLEREVQLIVLGSGEERYVTALDTWPRRYPGRVGVEHRFNDRLARLIYGGSDLFLMPSRYEPCGLGQMIAMRYGAIPIVRATGGLKDSVLDAGRYSKRGNGFSFEPYSAAGLIGTVDRALKAFEDRARWIEIQQQAMAADFSWQSSAEQYVELYRRAVEFHQKAQRSVHESHAYHDSKGH
jgi:starch synthase